MHATRHSRTAEYMALFRALETARSPKVRLFDDPWARRFLRPSLQTVAALARVPPLGRVISRFIDRRWPGGRTSGIARTCFIDEVVSEKLHSGCRQIVMLGAGFDCRAYRLPGATQARFFEVDHPNTSAAKQDVVLRTLGKKPVHVAFIAVDFNCQTLDEVLNSSGLDLARPVFFLWEGVTNYLTAEAVDATFRYVATAAPGSGILFTYVHSDVLKPKAAFAGLEAVQHLLDNASEPWTFGFDPAELPAYLAARGLRLVSDLGAVDYRACTMGETGARSVGYEFYRAAVADIIDA
jgi:methyltransferase (TIGR00027 family)